MDVMLLEKLDRIDARLDLIDTRIDTRLDNLTKATMQSLDYQKQSLEYQKQHLAETNAIRQSFPVTIRKAAAGHSKQS